MVKVRFFQTSGGRTPVADHIRQLPRQEAAQVAAVVLAIESHGIEAAGVVTRHIEGKLWEVKISAQRIFYVIVTGPEVVFLHAYRKQGQKAPKNEIDVAKKRMKEVLSD